MYNIPTPKKMIIKCKELFHNMFGSSLYIYVSVTTGPLRGSHDADDDAHSENEFDTPDLIGRQSDFSFVFLC